MSVHSLLLVDALQTFGSDYDLVVASHKNVSVDRRSEGQILRHQLHQALQNSHLHHLVDRLIFLKLFLPWVHLSTFPSQILLPLLLCVKPMPGLPTDILDPTALISIDLMLESPNCPTLEDDDEQKIVNIQFNSLDVIANQETIIELIELTQPQYSQ